jgi:hypothetical protein
VSGLWLLCCVAIILLASCVGTPVAKPKQEATPLAMFDQIAHFKVTATDGELNTVVTITSKFGWKLALIEKAPIKPQPNSGWIIYPGPDTKELKLVRPPNQSAKDVKQFVQEIVKHVNAGSNISAFDSNGNIVG